MCSFSIGAPSFNVELTSPKLAVLSALVDPPSTKLAANNAAIILVPSLIIDFILQ
jgi:hypothetical protein